MHSDPELPGDGRLFARVVDEDGDSPREVVDERLRDRSEGADAEAAKAAWMVCLASASSCFVSSAWRSFAVDAKVMLRGSLLLSSFFFTKMLISTPGVIPHVRTVDESLPTVQLCIINCCLQISIPLVCSTLSFRLSVHRGTQSGRGLSAQRRYL